MYSFFGASTKLRQKSSKQETLQFATVYKTASIPQQKVRIGHAIQNVELLSEPKSYVKHVAIDVFLRHEFCDRLPLMKVGQF